MTAMIFLGIGLEYIDAVFQTIKASDFSQYTIAGMKTLAVLFFLINILKKYNEGVANKDGENWQRILQLFSWSFSRLKF